MNKFFICSDIHSAYTPWMEALNEAGFDENNDNHKIIVCGDLFDRMGESCEVYKFVNRMIEKNKIILIRGNHENLLVDCIESGFPYPNDYSNGTFKTICDLGGAGYGRPFDECCRITWNLVNPILNKMVNYFETEHYVFIHSTIPPKEDWRTAHFSEWADAMWGNPFDFWEQYGIENKTVVFGHWHTSYYNSPLDEFNEKSDFGIAYGDGFIGLDACTAFSGKVNVLVIEDEYLSS